MKKEFTTQRGSQGMIIDCGSYEVEIFKSTDPNYYSGSIKYTDKKSRNSRCIIAAFNINWDEEKDGGKLELKYRDRWGSEMNFIHYHPSSLKGMFDFIGKGYNIFDDGFSKNEALIEPISSSIIAWGAGFYDKDGKNVTHNVTEIFIDNHNSMVRVNIEFGKNVTPVEFSMEHAQEIGFINLKDLKDYCK